MHKVKEVIIISNDILNKTARKNKRRKQRKRLLFGCAVIIILLFVLLILTFTSEEGNNSSIENSEEKESFNIFSVFSRDPRIPEGVIISGVPVGGMTEEKAFDALKKELPGSIFATNLEVCYGKNKVSISPEESGVTWDIERAVACALTGSETIFDVELSLNKTKIMELLYEFFDSFGGVYSPSSYWLEGEMPDVDTKTGECQTLFLKKGAPGYVVDLQDLYDQIVKCLKTDNFRIELSDLGDIKNPSAMDLEYVTKQVSVPAVNPGLNRNTLEIIPGKDGYGFDIEQAANLLEKAKQGEIVKLAMEYISPTLSEDDVWYQDTLGYCKTPYTDNEDRNENLRLACSKLNGLILQPGEVLSYNLTLGQRTREAGYKAAPAYSGVELVNEIGGGICQVSSTLYLSALFAELNIIERRNHGFPANYIPLGLDATVNWGTTDLKIRNDYDLPVKILAEVCDDGNVSVRIMGVERRDYYVKMEYRVDDHPSYAAAYRCRYDRETDEEIFRNLDHTSIYLEDVWCWPGYAENATDEP